ncbi:thiosulfate sulfurtransferase [Dethiosulfovibrio sp. F2B]|uniref:rhodanese-like domain-containing protein n=1 Tax=Dethiosulfovibrio faecalis TaxID=2720018 RepID=UPI001F3FA5B5|nr:rhodanese-like domain-containing protein [Dethiosulfovibrio faecalis]MCF4151038.1 thiosulfate sulfurtransferase [Dethiosulfovibrio faecalis]
MRFRTIAGFVFFMVSFLFRSVAFSEEVDTNRLKELVNGGNCVLVDVRDSAAFNGWKLDGVSRGGHIAGAVNFAASWLGVDRKDREEVLDQALADKGIAKDKTVVLYDVNGRDSVEVERWLEGKGFENVLTYDGKKWIDDPDRPVEVFSGYSLLIPAEVLKDLVDGKRPETFEKAGNVRILEASWGEEKTSYAKGHVPGSVHVNTDWVEPPEEYLLEGDDKPVTMWILASSDKLIDLARRLGVSSNDTVVVTGEHQMAAYRVAFVMEYLGVADVRVLDGGNDAWVRAGYPLEKDSVKPEPIDDFGRTSPGRPEILDTMDETRERLVDDPDFVLVDVRTWDEHIGKVSGYSYHHRKGRIPGSVFAYAGKTDSNSLDYYRNVDGTMREPREILAMWKDCGVDTSKHLSFMCGSGWRVAEVWFYSRTMGLRDTSMFSDGWIGWSNAGYPFETGEPAK